MRRAARTDANHAEIVQILKQAGCTVLDLSAVGKGCPDLAVGRRGVTYWIEVKDGSKPPSARALTPDQTQWHDWWKGGSVRVVCTAAEAMEAIK